MVTIIRNVKTGTRVSFTAYNNAIPQALYIFRGISDPLSNARNRARPPACMHVHVPMQTRSRKSRIIFSRFLSDVQRPPTDNRRAFRKMGGKEQKKKNEKNEKMKTWRRKTNVE